MTAFIDKLWVFRKMLSRICTMFHPWMFFSWNFHHCFALRIIFVWLFSSVLFCVCFSSLIISFVLFLFCSHGSDLGSIEIHHIQLNGEMSSKRFSVGQSCLVFYVNHCFVLSNHRIIHHHHVGRQPVHKTTIATNICQMSDPTRFKCRFKHNHEAITIRVAKDWRQAK